MSTHAALGTSISAIGLVKQTWTPLSLVATVISDTAINLTWTGGKLAKVERSTDGVNYTQIGTGTDTYSDTGLTEGTLYYYRVKGGGYSNIVSTYTFETEYSAIYAEMPDKPSVGVAQAQNGFVRDRKDSGVWAKLDKFLFFGTPLASQSLINWKNPGTLDPVLSATSPTFEVYKGYLGVPASSTFINTKFNPTRDGVNFINGNASLGFYLLNNKTASNTTTVAAVTYSPGDTFIQIDSKVSSTGNKIQYALVSAAGGILLDVVNNDSYGFYHFNKIAAGNAITVFKDSTKSVNGQAWSAMLNLEVHALCRLLNAGKDRYSDDQMGAIWFGSSLSDAEVADLKTGLETLLNYRDNRPDILGRDCYYFGDSITFGELTAHETDVDWVSLLTTETGTIKHNNGVSSMSLLGGRVPSFSDNYQTDIPVYNATTSGLLSFAFGVVDLYVPTYANVADFIAFYDTVLNYAINTKGWPKNRIMVVSNSLTATSGVALMTAIKNYCTTNSFNFYDSLTYMSEHGGIALTSDNVHPTNAGYTIHFQGLMREFKKWFIY